NLVFSQNLKKFWVTFTDKDSSSFDISQPSEYLSPRALERRANQNIPISENDLPVNDNYLLELKKLGVNIHNTSKWLNASSIVATDSIVALIKDLSFVDTVKYVGKHQINSIFLKKTGKQRDSTEFSFLLDSLHGYADEQIQMVKGKYLHNNGYRGASKMIAVLDGGFSNVDIMAFFDSLRVHGKLSYQKDFVDGDNYVYESSSHGSQVLSVMGANIPGFMVGTAPDATYVCLKTEDTRGEYLIEECNWVAALEYADSLGVDVVNSSVGYTTFNDKDMNHHYDMLDGNTAIASKAANIAFAKGMIVVNSAGNDGNGEWKYIDVPADAIDILTVGAVNSDGKYARFSSVGPTPDGRVKPEIVALGKGTTVASVYSNKVNRSNGTSFSSPLIAGMVASLWDAFPEKTNKEIIEAVVQSASQFDDPKDKIGYGIPDFYEAYQILSIKNP
ncbi:S8 family serine peptidase, partial [Saprospiraceae bacterium]|nr:S8 family serine peptidase [Saprospiraceae bacterium]